MALRRAKIVCTLGPAVASREAIFALVEAGMNVARINCAHGDWEARRQWIEWIRQASEKVRRPIGVLADLSGPKIRLGRLPEPMELETGQTVQIRPGEVGGDGRLPLPVPVVFSTAKIGDKIILDDGSVEFKVIAVAEALIEAKVVQGGTAKSHRGVTLVGRNLPLPSLTEKDEQDLEAAIEAGVDWLALSFVRSAADVYALRTKMRQLGADIPIIAKIEQKEAVANLEKIIDASDAIMVARGDLGLHLDLEEVPIVQKRIIRACNKTAKPVITATQMLESMIEASRPTRAEVTDVANAILDGTDAVMLSGETAIGKRPAETVKWMAKIAERAEKSLDFTRGLSEMAGLTSVTEAVAHAACALSHTVHAAAILSATTTGGTARWVSKFRPKPPIVAITNRPETARRLALVWGVQPLVVPSVANTDEMTAVAIEAALRAKLVKPGDKVTITAGVPVNEAGKTNLIQVQPVE